jgi:hypothetical protein
MQVQPLIIKWTGFVGHACTMEACATIRHLFIYMQEDALSARARQDKAARWHILGGGARQICRGSVLQRGLMVRQGCCHMLPPTTGRHPHKACKV